MLELVLFDLDGTLADTTKSIINSFKLAHNKTQTKFRNEQFYIDNFGQNLEKFIEILNIDKSLQDLFIRTFSENLNKMEEISLVKGMLDVLKFIKSKNIKIGIVTSKTMNSTIKNLHKLKISNFFNTIITSDKTLKHKPDPEPLLMACNELKIAPSLKVAFIGDTIHDMSAAISAGLLPIAVTWGPQKEKPCTNGVPKCVNSPTMLNKILHELINS